LLRPLSSKIVITDGDNELVDGSVVLFVLMVAFVFVYSVEFVKLTIVTAMIKMMTLPKKVQKIVNRPKPQFSEFIHGNTMMVITYD
jgi:hypothetical protein